LIDQKIKKKLGPQKKVIYILVTESMSGYS